MTGFDWLTAVLCCMALLLILMPERNPGQRKGGLALLGAAAMFQYSRGFDMPATAVAFHDDSDGVTVTGTVSNGHGFELKAIVITVYERDSAGNLLMKEARVMVNIVPAHQSGSFSVKVKKANGFSKLDVAAEGHWT